MSLIDSKDFERLGELRAHAEANHFTIDDMLDIHNGAMKPPGKQPQFFRIIGKPKPFKVVYTIEDQVTGTFRRLSISAVNRPGKFINPGVARVLMNTLGFYGDFADCNVSKEPIGPNHECIEIIQLIKKRQL